MFQGMSKRWAYDVFISYRRTGGAVKAELTKDELTKRGFRESRIFLDTRSLTGGDYLQTILGAIEQAGNIVVVITKDCFLDLPADSTWIKEIEHAIKLGKNIIPFYFDGITGLDAGSLPQGIRLLATENAVHYVHQYADASFDRLVSRLAKPHRAIPGWSKWLIGAVAAGGLAAGGYSALSDSQEPEGEGVYVVSSTTSKSYHKSKDCTSLRNARHPIIKVEKEEAIKQGKTPCKKCYGE